MWTLPVVVVFDSSRRDDAVVGFKNDPSADAV
jgi:hypothetical protein